MDVALFNKLACVNCQNSKLEQKQDKLSCPVCAQEVPLINNIPDFLSTHHIGNFLEWQDANSQSGEGYELCILRSEPSRLNRIDKPILKYVKGDVLEIGCGTCRLAEPVEKLGGVYFGLDPMLGFLLYANKSRELARLVRGQGERLPFQNESFDTLISGYYAYRNVNPQLGLPEARRVLKLGGRFAFDLLNYWCLTYLAFRKQIAQRDWKNFFSFLRPPHLSAPFEFFSLSRLKQQTWKANFLVEKIISTPMLPIFSRFNKYLINFYYRSKAVYLGYDVIIVLKAV